MFSHKPLKLRLLRQDVSTISSMGKNPLKLTSLFAQAREVRRRERRAARTAPAFLALTPGFQHAWGVFPPARCPRPHCIRTVLTAACTAARIISSASTVQADSKSNSMHHLLLTSNLIAIFPPPPYMYTQAESKSNSMSSGIYHNEATIYAEAGGMFPAPRDSVSAAGGTARAGGGTGGFQVNGERGCADDIITSRFVSV